MTHAWSSGALAVVAASEESEPYTYDTLKPGPWALLVTALLILAVVLLVRSLRTQLRKVDFDETAETDAERAQSRRPDDAEPR